MQDMGRASPVWLTSLFLEEIQIRSQMVSRSEVVEYYSFTVLSFELSQARARKPLRYGSTQG